MRNKIILSAISLFFPFLTQANASDEGEYSGFMHMMGDYTKGNFCGMTGSWGWMGMIFMAIFWGAIIFGIILLIKWLINNSSKHSPLDVLKEKYAKGEINKEEFEEKKKDLE